MAEYTICEGCKKLIEYKPETKYEMGTSYIVLKCPFCGYTKTSNKSHVHYGNDGLK